MTQTRRNITLDIWRGSDEGEYQSFEVPQRDNQYALSLAFALGVGILFLMRAF